MLNLYGILLENLNIDRLIEEGKDPIELLNYKFQNVPSDIITKLIEIDPTKKKSYSQWVLSKWENESDIIESSLNNGRIAKLFNFFKEHQEKQIKDCPSIQEGLDAYVPEEDSVLTKSTEEKTYLVNTGTYVSSELANDFDIIFNEDNWIIAVPNTYEASCKLGENCWWCTANHFGNGRSYYEDYLGHGGKYYINFDMSKGETLDDHTRKDYPFTRYQFHFESNQFKAATKGEPTVNIDEIGMPQSAYDFYENDEGKDMSDLESIETRMERYEERRWDDAITLNDEIYLNVEYNRDYRYEEPDLNSDEWYIFSTDDSMDPISCDSVDPNIETSLVYESINKNVLIIKKRNCDDEFIIVTNQDSNNNRWENWRAKTIESFLPIGDLGVFTSYNEGWDKTDAKCGFAFYCDNSVNQIVFDTRKFVTDEIKFLINTNIKWDNDIFIEVKLDDGYHSLIRLDNDEDLDYVIKRDLPIEGNTFLQDGSTIHGKFRDYSLLSDNKNDDSYYHLSKKLDNGDYLVEKPFSYKNKYDQDEQKFIYNILNKNTKQLLFDFWFDNVATYSDNTLVITVNGKDMLYTADGQPIIKNQYDKITNLINNSGIVACISGDGKNGFTDLIDKTSGEQIIRIRRVDTNFSPINNCIMIRTYSYYLGPDVSKVFNYKKRDFEYKDSAYETNLFSHSSYFVCCNVDGKKIIRDYSQRTDVNLEVDNYLKISQMYESVLIVKNHKMNLITTNGLLLPFWCDKVVAASDLLDKFVAFKEGEKYYYYDLETKNFAINPNGFDYCPYDNRNSYGGGLKFRKNDKDNTLDKELCVYYSPHSKKFSHYSYGINSGLINEFNSEEEARLVHNFIAELTGQQPSSNNQTNVSTIQEKFKIMLNRIDNARKLNHRQYIP